MYTIDENNELSVALLAKLIKRHMVDIDRFEKLRDYYEGRHTILGRTMSNPDLPNNRLVCNYAKYIVDMSTGYLLGVPVEYESKPDIQAVLDAYYKQTISNVDSELAKQVGIYGVAYELLYADEKADPKSAKLSPQTAFLVCNDTVEEKKLFAVHYYPQFDIDGNLTGHIVNVYTPAEAIHYKVKSGAFDAMEETGRESHYFGGVPLIEYENNDERQGDFEQVISLMDAYNVLMSDRVNDKEQLVDAILVIINAQLGKEGYNLLKEQRGIELPEGSDAKFLTKQLTESDVEVLKKAITDDIHKFSLVPNLTDELFAGNLSGVAIRYKLFGFNQLIKTKERYFESGLMERFELYNNYLNVKSNMPIIPTTEVSAVFSRNLPVNEMELAQMAATLKDTLSDESIITLLTPLLSSLDPAEELKKLNAQRKEKVANAQSAFGYTTNTPASEMNEDEE